MSTSFRRHTKSDWLARGFL